MWEEITWITRERALCHRLRSKTGTNDKFLKTKQVLVESLSNQMFDHLLWATYSKARIKPCTSTMKTEQLPKLQVKAPKNVPKWSRKKPPQAPWLPITEPSVLTLTQKAVGAFLQTETTSLICRLWWGTKNKSISKASKAIHLPEDKLPLVPIKQCTHTWITCMVVLFEENRRLFLAHHSKWSMWTIAAK